MQLSFDTIDIADFKHIKQVSLKLPHQPYQSGLHFIRGINERNPRLGANECGKSSLLDAMCWCLYGRTPDNLRNPDIKPWRSGGTPSVTMRLRTDNERHVIHRTASTNGLSLDSKKVGQEHIDQLLGINYATFTQTILLGQGQPLFFDLEPREKMRLFSEVLQLDRWEARSKFASDRTNELERQGPILLGRIEGGQSTLKKLGDLIVSNKSLSDEWEEGRAQRIAELEKAIKEQKARQQKLQAIIDKAELAYDGALTELRAANKQLEDARILYSQSTTNLVQAEVNIRNLEREFKSIGDTCLTCGQSLKGTALQKHKDALRKKIAAEKAGLVSLSDAVEKAEEATKKLNAQREGFQKKADLVGSELRVQRPEIAALKAKIGAAQDQLKQQNEDHNPYREQLRTLRKQQDDTESAIETSKEELDKLQAQIERTKFWIKGFKDIRLYLIEDALEELEIVTNSMLPDFGLDDRTIQYAVERETQSGSIQRGINVTVLSPENRGWVRWECWSGGVKQRMRLVGALALSDVLLARAGISSDLECLDEPSRSLSSEGIEDLCQALAERAKLSGKRILYVDHSAVESSHFSSVLTVVRSKAGVSLRWGG